MQTRPGIRNKTKLIAWNGIQLQIPSDWDVRVSGNRHLVFEKDFQPQVQIRWEKSAPYTARNPQKRLTQFAAQMGSVIAEDYLPVEMQQLQDIFGMVTCYQEKSGMVKGGVCLCADCHTLVLFQLLSTDPALLGEVSDCLSTLMCHNHQETLWRIQDFSLTLPDSYILQNYTFGVGLTRLSFYNAHFLLQTCTLGPADARLTQQTLKEILSTLADTPDLAIAAGDDHYSCEGHRKPTIPRQILFRLRREKPFICAKIRHDIMKNRLLTVILSSNRPISLKTFQKTHQKYEII